ncbi:uncharacterized protein B0H18DRAFT_1085366 [Fomitopsis serialis]|uniref:uncharacterized protein n=1 Tax=Fomitopsis serialis TaxID=139415 RepID=UPI00200768BF|nr:uncharacterized protein B0H18DRAFT_1085366 [Neoantrodia serialis]KAH9924879.1 hypothetical protein B0H18DRAFT_1085366 [Neoantrodia serialis]
MPAIRATSARPRRQYTPLATSNSDDSVIIISARSKQKNRAPVPQAAEVVEISSDDEAVASRPKPARRSQHEANAHLQRQLKEALQEVERLRKEARAAEKQKAVAEPPDPTLLADLEESVTCEICTLKMWAPFALPCGHTFCQTCLQDWFGSTQAQHLTNYPQQAGPDLAAYRNPSAARTSPRTPVEAAFPRPKYTCPTCRTECKTRPTEVFALKSITERVAKAQGENAPEKSAPVRSRPGQPKLIDGPFDGFFPGHRT